MTATDRQLLLEQAATAAELDLWTYVDEHLAAPHGWGFERIAAELYLLTGVYVSGQALRGWHRTRPAPAAPIGDRP